MRLLRKTTFVAPAILALFFGAVIIVKADTIAFTGSRYEEAPAAALGGKCGPIVPTLIVNSTVGVATGTSNLGMFTADESACLDIPFPAPITDGVFTFTFDDGDTLTGTFSGLATRVNIPTGGHLLDIDQTYIIAGGTGAFAGATGSISETGTGMSTGIYAINNYTFDGTVTAPSLQPVPEPTMLVFVTTGLVGAVAKFRRARKTLSTP